MPIDPGISQGIIPPPNPLAVAGQAATLQNHLNQSALFNLQTQSQMAVGHVLQQSIGDDGEIDLQKALTLSRDNPIAAYGMQGVVNQALQRSLTQAQISEKYLKMSHDVMDTQNTMFGALLGKDNVTDADMKDATEQAYRSVASSSNIPDSQKRTWMDSLIRNASSAPAIGTPAFKEWLVTKNQQSMDAKQRLDALTGTQHVIKAGDKDVMVKYDPQRQASFVTGIQPSGLTPEKQSELIKSGPLGVPTPRRDVAPTYGGGGFQGATGPGAGGQPGAQPNLLSGPAPQAPPSAQTDQVAPGMSLGEGRTVAGAQTAPPAPAAQATPMRPPVLARPAPGGSSATTAMQENTITTQGPKAAEYKNNLDERVQVGSDMMKRLGEVIPLLDKMRQGGGADIRAKLAEYAQAIPGVPKSIVDGINGGDLAASQEFQKFMVQYSTEQLKQIMTGATGKITNLEWDVFQKNNPRLNTDPDAIKNIFNFAQKIYGWDRQEQSAYLKESQKSDFNPTQWPAKWQQEMTEKGIVKPNHLYVGPRTPVEPAKAGSKRPLSDYVRGP